MTATERPAGLSALRSVPALDAQALRWRCPPVRRSRRRPPVGHLLGQERPEEALRTGLAVRAAGYHVFVSGPPGSGRLALVQHVVESMREHRSGAPDRVFLHDFAQPHRPRLLSLPPGSAPAFRDDLLAALRQARAALVAALTGRRHQLSRRLVMQGIEDRRQRLLAALQRLAASQGCALVVGDDGSFDVVADSDDPVAGESRQALLARLEELQERLRRLARRTADELRVMDGTVTARVLAAELSELRARWPQPLVAAHLDAAARWLQRAVQRTAGSEPSPTDLAEDGELEAMATIAHTSEPGAGCPFVIETAPTFASLFGGLESAAPDGDGGAPALQSGALLRADGGFLVLRAAQVLPDPALWRQLLRVLDSGKLEVRELDPGSGMPTGFLQPEAIPLDVKVIVIGEPALYEHLCADDRLFADTFKVHAEFDASVPASEENRQRYADVLGWLADREGLRAFAPDAVAAVVEYGARRVGRRERLSACVGEIADVGREASWWCERDGSGPVRRRHVVAALRARDRRLDLAREQIERDLHEGVLLVHTDGMAVGQVNSLTVLESGTFAFGKPCRITASTGVGAPGRSGVVNIEREAELSGPLHDKGVMILAGYLLERFGQDGVLCLAAHLCFEQSYGGVEGDSASSAELYALLSSLSKLPIDQGIGITGSVNQKGEIQAVAGVNEKIEGFFRLCAARGLTGAQGVLIPRANVPDLMLAEEVVEAVEQDRFAVYAIDRVEEGLAVLTGRAPIEVLEAAGATLARFRRCALGGGAADVAVRA